MYLVVIVYLSITPDPPRISDWPYFDKLEHLLAYCILMGWFGQLHGSIKHQSIFAISFCLIGISLEFIQGWSGYRLFDVADMAANTLGVLLGWWLSRALFAGILLHVDRGISQLLTSK